MWICRDVLQYNGVSAAVREGSRSSARRWRSLAALASTAQAYTFGQPAVSATGPEVRVFDWSVQKCTNDDIPDQPTRAFRDSNGQVVMINSHHTVRRYLGGSLATVAKVCGGIMFSGVKRDPALYDDREWLASTVHPGRCHGPRPDPR